jgi:hypothetical protein
MEIAVGYTLNEKQMIDGVRSFAYVQGYHGRMASRLLVIETNGDLGGDGKQGRNCRVEWSIFVLRPVFGQSSIHCRQQETFQNFDYRT